MVSGAASRSEAICSIPIRDFPTWLGGRTVSPLKVGVAVKLYICKDGQTTLYFEGTIFVFSTAAPLSGFVFNRLQLAFEKHL